jgi:hypothetical protein
MKGTLPARQRLFPRAEPVDDRRQPGAEAINQDRSWRCAQRLGDVAGLHRVPVRWSSRAVIGDAGGPFGVGSRVGRWAGRDVTDLGTVRKQRLGVTGLTGTHASGDQNASINEASVLRIGRCVGHRR